MVHHPHRAGPVAGGEYPGRGPIVTGPDEVRRARDVVYHKYDDRYGGDLTGWREMALPIAVGLEYTT